MLHLEKVSKHYGGSRKDQVVKAVDDVTFTIQENEIFALIGESGSGKSTLAELIVGLQHPTSGSIKWVDDQKNVPTSRMQIVFQNPDRSMNPYWRVKDIVTEPLRLSGLPRKQAYARAEALLGKVMLPADFLERYPFECSGGQKQRIAVARALSMSPQLLVADEITSALDPSTEHELQQLLLSLKQSEGMTMLYITHRLETIAGFADRVAVMKDGVIQEMGDARLLLDEPKTAYTQALLRAGIYG